MSTTDKRPALTRRQQEVIGFIQKRLRHDGYSPTIREIGRHLGIRSTNGVTDHLKALKRKGYLTQKYHKSRTLMPIDFDPPPPPVTESITDHPNVPILGRVAAGEPILAEERAEGSVVIDSLLLGRHDRVFGLRVVGQSMIDDGILDGDFIFVRKRADADPGDIVVVIIDDEATVKRYYPEGDRIRLQPANTAMTPIFLHQKDFRETQIIGVVVGVYRKL